MQEEYCGTIGRYLPRTTQCVLEFGGDSPSGRTFDALMATRKANAIRFWVSYNPHWTRHTWTHHTFRCNEFKLTQVSIQVQYREVRQDGLDWKHSLSLPCWQGSNFYQISQNIPKSSKIPTPIPSQNLYR